MDAVAPRARWNRRIALVNEILEKALIEGSGGNGTHTGGREWRVR